MISYPKLLQILTDTMNSTESHPKGFHTLKVAVTGAGLGGLCVALWLRRVGHNVTVFKRYELGGEVWARISTASNGT